jgi:polyisoprenoid-binding protein YceI
MMSSKVLAAAKISIVGLSLSLGAVAYADTYKIDSAHSAVNFRVKHLISKTGGRFKTFSGQFDFDPTAKSGGNLDVKIVADSIDTDNAKRDEHLRSPDFLDTKKFPELSFKSTKVETDGKKITVTGNLTLHGVTKPATLVGEYVGEVKDPMGSTKAGFNATTKINRKDFGVVWNKTLDSGGLVLGEDVEIELLVEAENVSKAVKK